MKIEEIKAAYAAGKNVPLKFAGAAIGKDAEMFFSYLMDNNPTAVNNTLRLKMGHDYLPFAPDRKAMGGAIHSMIVKGDTASLQALVEGFKGYGGFDNKVKNYTTDMDLRKEILKHLK